MLRTSHFLQPADRQQPVLPHASLTDGPLLPALEKIEKAEDYLLDLGFTQFRIRLHSNLARIELTQKKLKKRSAREKNIKAS